MNNISIRKMRIFLAVVAEKNFTNAAMRENISQPAATVAINQIEETFGENLFQRKGAVRKAELTSEGVIVADTFARIVASYDMELAGVDLAAKAEVKTKRIALQSGFCGNFNPIWLSQFHSLMGDERIIFEEMTRDQIIEKVAAREVDIGLLEGKAENSRCDVMTLSNPTACLLVPPTHMLADCEETIRWRDIPEDCYALSAMSDPTWASMAQRLEAAGKSFNKMHLYKNVSVMKSMAQMSPKPILMFDAMAYSVARDLGYEIKHFNTLKSVQTTFSMILPWGHLHRSNAVQLRGLDCFMYDTEAEKQTVAA